MSEPLDNPDLPTSVEMPFDPIELWHTFCGTLDEGFPELEPGRALEVTEDALNAGLDAVQEVFDKHFGDANASATAYICVAGGIAAAFAGHVSSQLALETGAHPSQLAVLKRQNVLTSACAVYGSILARGEEIVEQDVRAN